MSDPKTLARAIVNQLWTSKLVTFDSDARDHERAIDCVAGCLAGESEDLTAQIVEALEDCEDVADVYGTDEEIAAAIAEARRNPNISATPPRAAESDPLEARQWLEANDASSPLAANRFDGAGSAQDFVETLYKAGAVRVVIEGPTQSEDYVTKETHPYAETLRVFLPADAASRVRLFRIFAREAKREGNDAPIDRGEPSYMLWWD